MDLFFDEEFRSIIPPLQPEEYQQLEVALIKEGNRDSIVIWKENKILLDGHNRYDICTKNNIELRPRIELSLPNRDAAVEWIIQNQFGRRNLNKYQRSVLALRLEGIYNARAKENERDGGNKAEVGRQKSDNPLDTKKELAKIAHVSHDTVMKVKSIEYLATPEQKAKLVSGDVTINTVYTDIKRTEAADVLTDLQPLPQGIWDIIYADPPWRYEFSKTKSRSVESHYPSLSLEDICNYRDNNGVLLRDIIAENAILFLWATQPKIREALEVITAWGFEYRTGAVWVKDKIGMGYYFREQHELLLIAKKGKISPPLPGDRHKSIIESPRAKHSEKPAHVHEIIQVMYPRESYLEVFGRSQYNDKWVVFGNGLK